MLAMSGYFPEAPIAFPTPFKIQLLRAQIRKSEKNTNRFAFSDDDHSELSCDLCGNLHFASTKPPLLTKHYKNLWKTHDFEAAAFRVLGGPLFASIGLGVSEMLPGAEDSRHAQISNRKYSCLAV